MAGTHPRYPLVCQQCGQPGTGRKGARFCSKSCSVTWQRANCTIRYRRGSEHYAFKETGASYKTHHQRVRRARGRANQCELRSTAGCTSKIFEWSHIHGTDPGNPDNYRALCGDCHTTYDNQRGSGHANAKLTDEQVEQIRRRYVPRKVSQQKLASEFGVSQSVVSKVIRGERYIE